jgi:hypothetical protein
VLSLIVGQRLKLGPVSAGSGVAVGSDLGDTSARFVPDFDFDTRRYDELGHSPCHKAERMIHDDNQSRPGLPQPSR